MDAEHLRPPEKGECKMELADRRSLFQILSFLDEKLPLCSAIHCMVNAAVLTADPNLRVYFNSSCKNSDGEQNYAVILGARLSKLTDSNQKSRRNWMLTSWAPEDEILPFAIDDALKEINWSEDNFMIDGKEDNPNLTIMRQFLHLKQGPLNNGVKINSFVQYYLPLNEALSQSLRMPADVYVQSLELCHAQVAFDFCPYSKETSVENIAREIELFPSAGVFLKATDELVAWMMFYPPNGMSRLHTQEIYRRKGYASLAIRYLSKRCAQAGFLPTVNVISGDVAPTGLYKKLGFKHLKAGFLGYDLGRYVVE